MIIIVDIIITYEFRLIDNSLIETIDDNICSELFYFSPERVNYWDVVLNKLMTLF